MPTFNANFMYLTYVQKLKARFYNFKFIQKFSYSKWRLNQTFVVVSYFSNQYQFAKRKQKQYRSYSKDRFFFSLENKITF